MAGETQERILDAALALFSRRGCDGTSMSDIARAVGLTKAALYKHYESKEQLREALLDSVEAYYAERFGSKTHPLPVPETAEEFYALADRLAELTLRDEKIVRTRRMLTLEQFRDGRSAALATAHFNTGLETMFTVLFTGMREKGLLLEEEPAVLAFAYSAPVSSLIRLSDREPGKAEETLEKIRAFTRFFMKTYGKNQ